MGWSAPNPGRFTYGKETRYPLYRRLRESQGQSGWVRKILPPTRIRPPDCPARCESLYQLKATPAHSLGKVNVIFRKLLPLQRVWLTVYNTIRVEGQFTVLLTLANIGSSGIYSNSEPPEHEQVPTYNETFHISQYCMTMSPMHGHTLVPTCDQVRTF